MAEAHSIDPWLRLSATPGIGPRRLYQLLQRHGSAAEALRQLPFDESLPASVRKATPNGEQIEAALHWLEQPDCHLVTLNHPHYPQRLREIADPPPLLFLRGDPTILSTPQLALVGSRNPSRSGEETAVEFARHLARVGLSVTSGLASGIDAAAHRGALDGDGATIAVMGTGPDRIYPARNRDLAHRIVAAGGVLVSEFFPGTGPLAENFPRRNRIISGLSLGTLVVEAALRSGSLITARLALEQGREVFAIPGSIHNPLAKGCHQLLRQGAKLVERAEDILEELAPQLHEILQRLDGEQAEEEVTGAAEELDPEYRQLLQQLDFDPASVDQLVERSGLTPEAVSSMLLLLELQGLVVAAPGGYTRAK